MTHRAQYLSIDARFAICNMTTEFGGIAGLFVPDHRTSEYLNNRKSSQHRQDAHYFLPDTNAEYYKTFIIDLSEVGSLIALFPDPDNVHFVKDIIKEKGEMKFDGVFIGACTTSLEDLILAALVLEIGLNQGQIPVKGKRKVTPGSLAIIKILEELGLIEIYKRAEFEVGVPGCS